MSGEVDIDRLDLEELRALVRVQERLIAEQGTKLEEKEGVIVRLTMEDPTAQITAAFSAVMLTAGSIAAYRIEDEQIAKCGELRWTRTRSGFIVWTERKPPPKPDPLGDSQPGEGERH